MNDVLAFLAIVVPAVALIAIVAAFLLHALGPLDLTALWYTPRATTRTWPSGVQEGIRRGGAGPLPSHAA